MNGMDGIADDDNFSDDGFEDLPTNALDELEQNAILSTQQVQQEYRQSISRQRSVAKQDQVYRRPSITESRAAYQLRPNTSQQVRPLQLGRHSFEDQSVDDVNLPTPTEEKISFIPRPQDIQHDISRRDSSRVLRPGALHYLGAKDGQALPHSLADDGMLLDEPGSAAIDDGDLAQALKLQVQELLQQREDLARELQAANSDLVKQRGEVAIIRANQDKAAKNYDRQLAALKKTAEEEAAKHQADVEATRAENERIATENRFLQQDLNVEAKRVKDLQHNLRGKSKDAPGDSPVTTPKKAKQQSYRDGFDDDDVRMSSPSKAIYKLKKTTPTAGNKRKRQQVNDNPIAPLVLSPGNDKTLRPSKDATQGSSSLSHHTELLHENGLRFLQSVHGFHPLGGQETLLEVFTKYSFPSEPAVRFSTILIEGSAALHGASLPTEFSRLIISMWSRALNEKYYAPVAIFVDVIKFVLALDGINTAPLLIPDLLPVLLSSVKVNGVPRFEHSPVSRVSIGKVTPRSSLTPEVNATDCLEILLQVAYVCLHNDEHIRIFWRTIDLPFILIMLNSSQPIADMTINLNLLATSIQPTTFGNILPIEEDQAAMHENQATNEMHIIERVGCLLFETPRVDEGEDPYTPDQISEFRIEVMSLLSLLALAGHHPHQSAETHGTRLLAQHPTAIARLVRSIYDEVSALYLPASNRALHSLLVNEGVRLFYHILALHGHNINLQQKLSAINGSVQKHSVVLTRLAFRDGPLMEAEIKDEICMMAHEMLEQVITPEEADSLLEVYPSQKNGR